MSIVEFLEEGDDGCDGVVPRHPRRVWMPKIDVAKAVRIAAPTPTHTVITTPRLPGLELHLPPGTVVRDREGRIASEISITPVPLDRPPFPTPEGLRALGGRMPG